MRTAERPWLALGFALAYLASWVLLRFLLLAFPIAFGLAAIGAICLLYLIFVFFVRPRAPWNDRRLLCCFLLVAAVSRLILFDVPPEKLSGDVYRYVWDGKVQLWGINPYRFAPDAEELIPLREPFHDKINHPSHQTIYPPMAQILFTIAYLLAGSHLLGLRLIYLILDLFAACWIVQIIGKGKGSGVDQRTTSQKISVADDAGSCSRPGLPPTARPDEGAWWGNSPDAIRARVGACRGALFIYLFSPLLVIETYVGMHIDVAGMAFLVGAYRHVGSRAPYRALALLVAAVLVKYIAVAAVPVLLLRLVRERRGVGAPPLAIDLARWAAWSLAVAAGLFIPYLQAAPNMLQTLIDFSLHWEFNSPVQWILVRGMGSLAPIARAIVFLGLLGYILSSRVGTAAGICWAVMALVLTSPAVFPWYLVTLAPFLALNPTLAGLAVTTLPFLSYLVLIDFQASGVWRESPWLLFAEYLPVVACLAMDVWRRRCIGERS